MTTELESLWSSKRIYDRLMEDAFVYRQLGEKNVNVLFLEHAQRAMGNMEFEYLDSMRSREWAWQQQVASRDKALAELMVYCALLEKQLKQMESARGGDEG